MNCRILSFLIILYSNFRTCQNRKYDGFSLYTLVPKDLEHLKFLQNLDSRKYMDIVFWNKPQRLHEDVQVIVNADDRELFMERAKHFRLDVTMTLPDVQVAFNNQVIKSYRRLRAETYTWDSYHTLEDIYQWLADITLKYPSALELTSIGKSAEERDIYVLTLKKSNKKSASVIVEGGIHGHEWLSTEFVLYLANQLISVNSTNNWKLREVSEKYTWHFLPVTNPDGYVYSHNEDRLWRKNRRAIGPHFGVDLNRNFPYSFGTFGASLDPKDENYCGPSSLSEPETKALTNFIYSKKNGLKFYFSFHAFGQKIIIPYSDRVKHLENYSEMENYSKQAIMKMYYLNGIKYKVGTTYDTSGTRISGDSASWVKKNYKVKYVFTFILRDNGSYGYALPVDQIQPTCEETLAGVLELMTAKPKRISLFGKGSNIRGSCVFICLLVVVLK